MTKPIRILHIVGTMNQGGIECLLMSLYRAIDKNKVQFDFLTHSKQKAFFDDEIESLGGRIFNIINPFSLKGFVQYKAQINNFFTQQSEYKIVHSHMNTFSGIILNTIKKTHPNICTRIAHSHTTCSEPLKIKTIMWRIARLLGQNSITHRFSCSKDAAYWSFSKFPDKSIIFNNAIDTVEYKFNKDTRNKYRAELNIDNNFILGHVGRFNAIKNHAFLLDVFAKTSQANSDAVLLLVGDGPLLSDMKLKANELGLKNKIIFLGNRTDVSQLLSAMDAFIFPSINEGLGIVAVEAQTSGLPCLVSDALPQEVKLTNNLHFLSLDESANFWANKINKITLAENREQKHLEISKQGYDINETSLWLTDFYLKLNQGKQ